jgi:hypothetical protein
VARHSSSHMNRLGTAAHDLFAAYPLVMLGLAFDIGYVAGQKVGELMDVRTGKRLAGLAAKAVSLVPDPLHMTSAAPRKKPRTRRRRKARPATASA